MLEGPVGSVIHRSVLMSMASDFNSFRNQLALLREESVLLLLILSSHKQSVSCGTACSPSFLAMGAAQRS